MTYAGNRCDVCGKFRKPAELVEYESKSLSEYGELREKWWLECDSCRRALGGGCGGERPGGTMSDRAILDSEEREAMDCLARYMEIVWNRWRMEANSVEQAAAVHVLQGAIIQHMLHRLEPAEWSSWWSDPADQEDTDVAVVENDPENVSPIFQVEDFGVELGLGPKGKTRRRAVVENDHGA